MEDNSTKRSFWQTLPGILTALAAILTAVTGLLLAFNQMGFFNHHSKETQANISSQNSSAGDTTKATPGNNKPGGEIIQAKFFMTDIKGKGEEHEYKILESSIEPKDPSNSIIKIKIRCTNNITYPVNFWNSGFRLSVDNVLSAPSNYLDEIVYGNTSKEGIVQFDFPNDAKKLELIIFDGSDKITVPFTISK